MIKYDLTRELSFYISVVLCGHTCLHSFFGIMGDTRACDYQFFTPLTDPF